MLSDQIRNSADRLYQSAKREAMSSNYRVAFANHLSAAKLYQSIGDEFNASRAHSRCLWYAASLSLNEEASELIDLLLQNRAIGLLGCIQCYEMASYEGNAELEDLLFAKAFRSELRQRHLTPFEGEAKAKTLGRLANSLSGEIFSEYRTFGLSRLSHSEVARLKYFGAAEFDGSTRSAFLLEAKKCFQRVGVYYRNAICFLELCCLDSRHLQSEFEEYMQIVETVHENRDDIPFFNYLAFLIDIIENARPASSSAHSSFVEKTKRLRVTGSEFRASRTREPDDYFLGRISDAVWSRSSTSFLEKERKGEKEVWRKPVADNRHVVFVHGLFGSFSDSWSDIQKLIEMEWQVWPSKITFWGYKSELVGRGSDIKTVAAHLETYINIQLSQGSSVSLIGHSMGGVLILETIRRAFTSGKTIDGVESIVLLATPILGSEYAKFVGLVNRQAPSITAFSDYLEELNGFYWEYGNIVKEKVSFCTVTASLDEYVKRMSSRAISSKNFEVNRDHFSIKDMLDADDEVYQIIKLEIGI